MTVHLSRPGERQWFRRLRILASTNARTSAVSFGCLPDPVNRPIVPCSLYFLIIAQMVFFGMIFPSLRRTHSISPYEQSKSYRHSLAIFLPRSHNMLPLNFCPYKVSVFGLLLSVSTYPFCDPHLALFLFTLSNARFSISGILAFAFRLADSCLCFALPFFGSVLYMFFSICICVCHSSAYD